MPDEIRHEPVALEARDVLVVVGKRGCGKSEFVKQAVIRQWPGRVLAWDPHREYGRDMNGKSLLRTVEWEEFLSEVDLDQDALRIAVYPGAVKPDERAQRFEEFIDIAATLEGFLLVVDECGLLKNKYGAEQALGAAATNSRHWGSGVPCVLVAQRATQITKDAREQATQIVSFRQNSPDDIKSLRDVMGAQAEHLSNLARFQCERWCDHMIDSPQRTQKEMQTA